ncbi:N-acetyl-gamma-glutamyl-phosphate reductase [Deinococcus cellulosilyticus]|uniref:N-acetyl-gamma-glutamyl-phosphate reductase n=1 Tax=Deinococcus cellulosilyticus (strain DSM 18568 / NBRC 106333 / KACC 11606 / 5516J-15) TaxID=1223518 RepID=A0A511N5F2_DEIC1|nr:N-acetyl-gamma-glutamyl-phosphate reductase [Deinococcus cellulosilyticus]GEM48082.1 N-acetyl-gamma-glutamyl-phosphate reductase 2 [Deinococcus cellulosilyticus NBRC 106333 = KACC 11606]
MGKPRVFIDGEAGTTGLQIRSRLEGRTDLELVSIDPALRKDQNERRRLINSADVVVLCLPDEASKEAVGMLENDTTRVLDASTAYRVAEGWTYGFPEMTPSQKDEIRNARFVSNPGCYSTGMIALVRPLVDAGILPANAALSVQGFSGYSGGGRQLVDAMENRGGTHPLAGKFKSYALGLAHKHVPEMKKYGALQTAPLFTPSVGAWRQGMLVQIPLHLSTLPEGTTGEKIHAALANHYAGQRFIEVMPFEHGKPAEPQLDPQDLNDTNRLQVFVFENASLGHVLLVARLDNLGKGASGAAAQNLDVMLGLEGDHDYSVPSDLV